MIKKIVILKPSKSLNFSESCNAGIKHSSSEKLFIANDDIIISENSLEELAKNTDDQTITGPDSNCNLGFQTDYAYTVGNIRLVPAMILPQVRNIIPEIYKMNIHRKEIIERSWLAFFATMFTRKCIEDVGLLDEAFIYDREDLSWCIKAKEKNKKFKQIFSSYCFHFGGISRKRKHQELGLKHDLDTEYNLNYFNSLHGIKDEKQIKGYPDYTITNIGVIISNKEWRGTSSRERTQFETEQGYLQVGLYNNNEEKKYLVHRLVAETFLPNPDNKPEVNHKNGNKRDNRVCNLEWTTAQENTKHAFDTGLIDRKGEKNGQSKLTDQKVLEIRNRHKTEGLDYSQLAKEYNVSPSLIGQIVRGNCWTHLIDKPLLAFYCFDAFEFWDEKSLNKSLQKDKPSGIGGSETQVILLSRELAKLGWKVKIFNKCLENHMDSSGDDVEYIPFQNFAEYSKLVTYDILVASRYLNCFDVPFKSKKNIAMIHDVFLIINGWRKQHEVLQNKIDKYFCLSNAHKQFVSQHHNISMDQIVMTSNGLDFSRFDKKVEKNPYKMIYSSSPDRGLEVLLDLFPKVKAMVPEVTLDIFYGFENFRDQVFVKKMLEKIKATPGVNYKGRIGQDELAEHFLESSIWAYPSGFSETFCITATEAMASQAVVLSSNFWGLIDVVKDGGILLPMPQGQNTIHTPEYQNKWVAECIKLLKDKDYMDYWRQQGKQRVARFSWQNVAKQWDNYFKTNVWEEIQ